MADTEKTVEENKSEVITQEPSKVELEDLVHPETKKNLKKIKCARCDSYILQVHYFTSIKLIWKILI